jgi:hypothetical protein
MRRFTGCFRCGIRDRLWRNLWRRRRAVSLRNSIGNCSRRMFESFDVLPPKRLRFVGKGLDEPEDLGIHLNWGRDN